MSMLDLLHSFGFFKGGGGDGAAYTHRRGPHVSKEHNMDSHSPRDTFTPRDALPLTLTTTQYETCHQQKPGVQTPPTNRQIHRVRSTMKYTLTHKATSARPVDSHSSFPPEENRHRASPSHTRKTRTIYAARVCERVC